LALPSRRLPGLEKGTWLGGVFLFGALAAQGCARRGWRNGMIGCVAAAGVIFTATLASWGVNLVDRLKASRPLAQALPADHLYREVRLGAIGYFQPSLVFYCQREVQHPENALQIVELLYTPLPVYLFVSAQAWEKWRAIAPSSYRLAARHFDLYSGQEVLLLTNEPLTNTQCGKKD